MFNNLAPWGENKFVREQKRTYKFKRGVINTSRAVVPTPPLNSHCERSVAIASNIMRLLRCSATRNDEKILHHPEFNSVSINADLKPLTLPSPTRGEDKRREVAFTLAEVLITLGIIGVVAAMTLPSLIQKYNDYVIISKYQKLYSTLSNAYNLAIAEYGSPEEWDITKEEFLIRLEPYLNISEKCYNKSGCTSRGNYVSLSGESMFGQLFFSTTFPKLRLNNGFSIIADKEYIKGCSYYYTNPDGITVSVENVCAQVYGVISNTKSSNYKNYFGKDFFSFSFTKQGLRPTGYNLSDAILKHSCSKSNKGNGNGDTCGAWILRYQNVDYLHN